MKIPKIDSKELIKKAWVIEVAVLVVYTVVGSIWLSAEKFGLYLQALPALSLLIGGQGLLAGVGPEAKRWIEMKREQARNGRYQEGG